MASNSDPFQTVRALLARSENESQPSPTDSITFNAAENSLGIPTVDGPINCPQTAQRLIKEVNDLNDDPPLGCSAGPKSDNLYEWAAAIDGPPCSVYQGGIFFMEISLGRNYPFETPRVTE